MFTNVPWKCILPLLVRFLFISLFLFIKIYLHVMREQMKQIIVLIVVSHQLTKTIYLTKELVGYLLSHLYGNLLFQNTIILWKTNERLGMCDLSTKHRRNPFQCHIAHQVVMLCAFLHKVSIDLCFFRVLDDYKNSFYPLLVDIFIPLKIAKRSEKICIELWNKIKRWYKGIQVIIAINI